MRTTAKQRPNIKSLINMEVYKDTDPIVLVFGADNGYVKQLAVAIYTCTSNIYQGRALDIHVISNNIKKENKIKINEIVKSKNKNKITWYDVHKLCKRSSSYA